MGNYKVSSFQLTRSASLFLALHTLVCMYATQEPGQHLRPRVPSVAGAGFITVAQALLPVRYAWNASDLDTGKSARATRDVGFHDAAAANG